MLSEGDPGHQRLVVGVRGDEEHMSHVGRRRADADRVGCRLLGYRATALV
jgi:hypothetical protein